MDVIPVHCPLLPSYERIAPYLKRIDSARWYSNFGPLVREFEARLAEHFNVLPEQLTTAANGTLMLTVLLKALGVAPGSLCVMPSWTFVATPASALDAGLIPYFVDVDLKTQALDPNKIKEQLNSIPGKVGAVIVVAPFGAPVDTAGWDAFSDETGIPVVIDAAAAFDTVSQLSEMRVRKSPVMISLHATKVFGIGEAALAISQDEKLIWRTKSLTGFGFNHQREALIQGSNAKLPEYTAAVGLAALDMWSETRQRWESVRDAYVEVLDSLGMRAWFQPDWVTSTCNIILPNRADELAVHLKQASIDTRKWWLNGCHRHKAYCHLPKSDMPNTEWLSRSVLGLPFAVDLDLENIHRIGVVIKNIQMEMGMNNKFSKAESFDEEIL